MYFPKLPGHSDYILLVVMILASISFCCYWFLFVSPVFKNAWYKKFPGDNGIIRHILVLKCAGLLMLGIIPSAIFLALVPQYNLRSIGVAFNPQTALASLGWIVSVGVPLVILTLFVSRRRKTFRVYPQIRVHHWDVPLMIRYCMAWAIYMLGYEMLFRGLLLFPLANILGVWPAIAVNITLYVSSHIPKGADETFAALFFGPLLCLITLKTGTIWAAWIIHVILAISNSMISLKFHPDFKVVDNRNIFNGEELINAHFRFL